MQENGKDAAGVDLGWLVYITFRVPGHPIAHGTQPVCAYSPVDASMEPQSFKVCM